ASAIDAIGSVRKTDGADARPVDFRRDVSPYTRQRIFSVHSRDMPRTTHSTTKKKLGTWRIHRQHVEQISRHAAYGRRRKFKKDTVLYEQGDISTRFYFVLKGLVQISIFRADGSEVVLELMGPETICGEGSAFDGL